jgi:hypothetical protein
MTGSRPAADQQHHHGSSFIMASATSARFAVLALSRKMMTHEMTITRDP